MPSLCISANAALTNWLDGSRRSLRTASQLVKRLVPAQGAGTGCERSERRIPRDAVARNVSVQVRRSFVRRNLQRLVGFHFHRLFLASLSQIVPAWFETFLSLWWRVRCARSSPLFSDPTLRVRGPDTLWRVPWTRLLGFIFSLI